MTGGTGVAEGTTSGAAVVAGAWPEAGVGLSPFGVCAARSSSVIWGSWPLPDGRSQEGRTKILIAIEPRSYREAIARVLGALRPSHEVTVAEPAEIGQELARLDPELAVCAVPNLFAPGERPAWVEFTPYEEPQARVCVGGQKREIPEVDLEDLISVIDEVQNALRLHQTVGGC